MLKVGITGGIGSGKSLVSKAFSQLGVPTYHADIESKKLVNTHPEIRSKLINLFGGSIYLPTGEIDRKKLASAIFKNEDILAKVNSIIHPRVRAHYEEWLQQHSMEPYTLHEAAISFETGLYQTMDYMILVTAPEDIRIQRVSKRDNSTEEEIKNRMKNQWPEEKKIPLANFIIINDDQKLIIPQILETDKKLKQYGQIC